MSSKIFIEDPIRLLRRLTQVIIRFTLLGQSSKSRERNGMDVDPHLAQLFNIVCGRLVIGDDLIYCGEGDDGEQ
jgi:hypothetical protein